MQKIIWPWDLKSWHERLNKLSAPINSIADLDARMSSTNPARLRTRQFSEAFNRYQSEELNNKISEKDFVENIISLMQKLLKEARKTFANTEYFALTSSHIGNMVLNRKQVATIITCMWLGLFNYNYIEKGTHKTNEFTSPNFFNIFLRQNTFALQCLIEYFSYISEIEDTHLVTQHIIIKRDVFEQIDWVNSKTPIGQTYIGEGDVSESPTKIHIIPAHECIGGDMFDGTLTQEEVTLLIRPECLIAVLFCSKMGDNDSITIIGAEKVSNFEGRSNSAKFHGRSDQIVPVTSNNGITVAQIACVFIDASANSGAKSQFVDTFDRDLQKAYCGFNSVQGVIGTQAASSNWSYGFMGSMFQVKFIQLLLAANQSGKSLVYHSVSKDLEEVISVFASWAYENEKTVGDIYTGYFEILRSIGKTSRLSDLDIFNSLMDEY